MRILKLRFKNLNSLYGEWAIDFTDPEYRYNGIFSLTGPTGAGKSTILDAICLALYGATPRILKINKSSNDVMSRRTGECYAELLFESQAGRFLCHWEQRRARKNADGKLQDQEHQIADADTGKPIETKKSLVPRVVEEKTGMDFDRFTRSILLAQGGFDSFLKADIEKKSKILEQITGTEIYTKISLRVHERRRDEQEKLNLLEAGTSGVVILEAEEEQQLAQDLKEKEKEEKSLGRELTKTEKAMQWLKSMDDLRTEIDNLAEEEVLLRNDTEAFKPDRDRLDLANKAASLAGDYATLTAIRKQQSDDRAALTAERESLPEQESLAEAQAQSLKSAEQQTIKAKESQNDAAQLIRQVRALDQTLDEQAKAGMEFERKCKEDAQKIEELKQSRLQMQQKRAVVAKEQEAVDGYLRENARDKWLIGGLSGIEEQLESLLSAQEEIFEQEAEQERAAEVLEKASGKLDKSTKQHILYEQQHDDASKKLQQGKVALSELLCGRMLREYRSEKDALLREMAFLARIGELEDHRAHLVDGKPCPLCGAEEHPFASGNVPVADATEEKIGKLTRLIDMAEELERTIDQLEKDAVRASQNLKDSEYRKENSAKDIQIARQSLTELEEDLTRLREDFIELDQAVVEKLQPLGITEIPSDDISSLLELLTERLDTWQSQVDKKADIEKQLAVLDSDRERLDGVIESESNRLAENQEDLAIRKNKCREGKGERINLYGEKSPDEEEVRLKNAVAAAEAAEKVARDLYSELQQRLNTAKAHIKSLQDRFDRGGPELKQADADFLTALDPIGFSDESQFLAARLSTEQRELLSGEARRLDHRKTDLEVRQKDRRARWVAESSKQLTDKSLDDLEPQFFSYRESLQQLREIIGGFRHKLKENEHAKKQLEGMLVTIAAQKKECSRWEKLHNLIGSADGKKYRNFAQGLTFELMVSHANRQLEKMTDRYLLIRDDRQPLELNVVDSYQSGEIRSTRNLSGGESFLVSLALALGLSRMASRKVRVDSLFLDEGFGTLDEDALETALAALSSLQQEGKLIGIISHVTALKERIGTQITVTPASAGRSLLAGPGCSKVA